MNRILCLIAAFVTAPSLAANGPPLASAWNIAATGSAASSGDLAFRITRADGSNPVDITVAVISGASQDSVARSIGRSLGSQLPRDKYTVQLGENANVLVSDPRGQPAFAIELIDSDIENVRVAVQSVTPAASPTVPAQGAPAEPPPATPPASATPGNPVPPPSNSDTPNAPPTPPH